jgi:2-polyprenyl-6-methoxyphenol hydroxylase-like FAD-dependent oxidoreductase
MRQTEVAIVGGGIAGSMTAALLGRAGIAAALIDPHPVYPPDFRCEKIDGGQARVLRRTPIADAVLDRMTPNGAVWTARYGRIVERRANDQFDAYYQDMVQALRDLIPPATPFVAAKVARISTTSDRQHLVLSNGDEIAARLVVLATGLNHALRTSLGIERVTISAMHSISVGFDMTPAGRSSFDFPALDYYPEQVSERIAYLTLFPIGSRMRANLFAYRDMRDPWFQELRKNPAAVLFAAMPGLKKITGDFTAVSDVQIRPVDLYRCTNTRQPGVVLVGDAFATSCPAAGTGLDKVFTDVERLCSVHIPQWLKSPGMGA